MFCLKVFLDPIVGLQTNRLNFGGGVRKKLFVPNFKKGQSYVGTFSEVCTHIVVLRGVAFPSKYLREGRTFPRKLEWISF